MLTETRGSDLLVERVSGACIGGRITGNSWIAAVRAASRHSLAMTSMVDGQSVGVIRIIVIVQMWL